LQPLAGEPRSPVSPPSGCVFRTRCPWAIERCAREIPQLRRVAGSNVACHRAEDALHMCDANDQMTIHHTQA
jgi:oligopeptide/dipeptide ABC transporter ATP-binding protein